MHTIQMETCLKLCGTGDGAQSDGRIHHDLCRGEGLVEALSDGLLRRCGVVATNFLPHVDLALGLGRQHSANRTCVVLS